MDLSPRAVIAGRYRVDTKVGAGGMGEVWLGEHIAVGVRVAVKTLLPAAAMNHEVVARFKREAYILGRIRSDHVARVVDFVADDLYGLVLVMEFVDGDPLSRLLQERTLTVEEGVDLAFGLTLALKDLHGANIIHRDLKPGNVMMQKLADGHRRAVVVDFGVSRLMSDKDKDEDEELTGITRADMAVGTIEYMAPEQILNSRNVAPGSDIYAVGAMLYRACAGRHVFGNVQSDTELAQKKLTTDAPPIPLDRTDPLATGFATVVAKMVKRRPSERYKTADDVYQDLLPLKNLGREADPDPATVNVKGSVAQAMLAAHAAQSVQAAQQAGYGGQGGYPAQPSHAPQPSQPSPASHASHGSHASQASHGSHGSQAAHGSHAPQGSHPSHPSHPSHHPSYPSQAGQAPQQAAVPAKDPGQQNVAGAPPRDSVPISGAVASENRPPAKRGGVPIVLTIVLVAAALAGGVFFGPKLVESLGGTSPATSADPAAPMPSVTATAAPSAAPSATATASAAPAATAAPSAEPAAAVDLDAGAGALSVDAGASKPDAGRFGGGYGYHPPVNHLAP